MPDVRSLRIARWHGSRGRQQLLLAHEGGVALGDRIAAAPLPERRKALQAARINRNSSARLSVCAPRFELRLFGHMGKPVGVLVRTGDKLAAVRVGNPFPAAPGKCTVAIFLDEQTPSAPGTLRGPPDVRSNLCDPHGCGNVSRTGILRPRALRARRNWTARPHRRFDGGWPSRGIESLIQNNSGPAPRTCHRVGGRLRVRRTDG